VRCAMATVISPPSRRHAIVRAMLCVSQKVKTSALPTGCWPPGHRRAARIARIFSGAD
jgi:hypothetical protein